MRVGLITRRKESGGEGSVMHDVASHLRARNIALESIYPDEMLIDVASVSVECDLYLLKAGTTAAIGYAGLLDLAGARLLNPYPAVVRIKDKVLGSRILSDAQIPSPETFIAAGAEQLAPHLDEGPLIIKPYFGGSQGRGVVVVRRVDEIAALATDKGLIFAQRYHEGDGRDYKIYRIGERYFGVRRVWPARTLEDKLGEPFEVDDEMREIARRCGEAFGIDLYGVDIIYSAGTPYVVDINSFPGFKGVPDAGAHLAEYIAALLDGARG